MERRDGTVLDCAAQPLPDGATLLTFIDVTASVNVERALTERNDALERASRLRDELRAPRFLRVALAAHQRHRLHPASRRRDRGALNPRQRDYAGHIMRSSAALLAILNDILDLASIDTGSLELMPEIVDIRSTIEAAMRGLEDRLAESSLTGRDRCAGGYRLLRGGRETGPADPVQPALQRGRLLGPGPDHHGSGPQARGRGLFEVRDEGRGIPPELRARVFERFESHTLGTRHRGVGLGLSIVRSFVELHGGRVELMSAPGSGTTVTCIFPCDNNEFPTGRSSDGAMPSMAAE